MQAASCLDAVGFVLAGGESRRMGTDKALVELGGRPLIAHAIGILAAAGVPAFIAGTRPEARAQLEVFAPLLPDVQAGLGPLGGVCTALASTSAKLAMFLPVDAPLLPASLVAYLLRHACVTDASITIASVNGVPQTFPAVVARRALPALERELREGRLGCLAGFRAAAREGGESLSIVTAETLAQSGHVSHPESLPVTSWFVNLNTRRDVLAAAARRASCII